MVKTLEEKREQHLAIARKLDARIRKQKRKIDTRRKILLGAYLLHKLESDNRQAVLDDLRQNLLPFLERDTDKHIFNDILNDKPTK